MTPPVDPSLFATAHSLASLKRQVAAHNPQALREAAQQFESLFINMMLKSMEQANFKDPLFGSSQQSMYQDMYNQQLSIELSKTHSFGLADMLVKQLRNQWGGGSGSGSATSTSPAGASGPSAAAGTANSGVVKTASSASSAQQTAFARSLWPEARRAAQHLGVSPVSLIAQAALETDWGRSTPRTASGTSSNNMFGIKAGAGWKGASVSHGTHEYVNGTATAVKAQFRAYDSCAQCFQDYAALLSGNSRYAAALGTGNDVGAFASALQQGGYATDPDYARKLTAVADSLSRALAAQGAGPLKNTAAAPISNGSSTL